MATKSRKKSSKKKATKSMARKTAQVELDPTIVHSFEAFLREGLIASGAVMMSAEIPQLKVGAKVELDSGTVARLGEILRDGLIASGAVFATDYPEGVRPTAKARATKKSQRKASPSKKR
jgi:hypothetical protein